MLRLAWDAFVAPCSSRRPDPLLKLLSSSNPFIFTPDFKTPMSLIPSKLSLKQNRILVNTVHGAKFKWKRALRHSL